MILDSTTLTKAQKCPRIYINEQTESRGKWEPKALFDSCLRAGIGTNALSAEATFRKNATKPGLMTKHDPWTLSGDYCAMLHTILEKLSRMGLPPMVNYAPQVEFGDVIWQPLSALADGGLIRFVTVERFDETALWRELHGWGVFGDMAATGLPMDLYFIEIGSIHNGRRHSPWCRSFKHPAVQNYFRFKPKEGSKLKGGWIPHWYADTARQDPRIWVDLMEKDQVDLIHRRTIEPLKPAAKRLFQYQLGTEAQRLKDLPKDFREAPMHKANCDWPTLCPWQFKCYDPAALDDPFVIYGTKFKGSVE